MRSRGIAIALVLGLTLVHLIHLGADTPPGLSSSDGLYVDEGYKTLSPRNLLLFGTTHWHPMDAYPGWMSISPITQWSYYASFKLFGANIEAARSVTILFFALLLTGFAVAMSGRYSLGLVVAGLVLLSFESTLFFLSRIAVFEIPLAAFVYGLLFIFARMKPHQTVTPVLLAVGTSFFLVFGIKASALLYLGPILLAASTFLLLEMGSRQASNGRRYIIAVVMVIVLGALLVLTRDWWIRRLEIAPLEIGGRILDSPLVHSSPVPVLAGILCALHGLVCRPDLFLRNIYRISLVAVVLFGIPLIAIFEYDPMRYYVPLLPAFLLIVLEWYHLRGWSFSAPQSFFPAGLVTVAVMTPWFYYLIGFLLMRGVVLFSGEEPSLMELSVVLVLAVGVWILRSFALRGRAVAGTLLLMLPLFLVYNTRDVGSFLIRPTFEAQNIRSDLVRVLPEGSTLAGVWAPFIALGTPFKALYLGAVALNWPMRLPEMAPDFVVETCPNRNSEEMLINIERTPGMSLGDSVYAADYSERGVIVYPLKFDRLSPTSRRRGTFQLGRALAREGDPAAAEPELHQALTKLLQAATTDPVQIAEARGEWGACLVQLGRHAEAEEPLLQAYQTFRPSGEAPAQVLAQTTLNRLIALYQGLNRPDEAARYRSLLENQIHTGGLGNDER